MWEQHWSAALIEMLPQTVLKETRWSSENWGWGNLQCWKQHGLNEGQCTMRHCRMPKFKAQNILPYYCEMETNYSYTVYFILLLAKVFHILRKIVCNYYLLLFDDIFLWWNARKINSTVQYKDERKEKLFNRVRALQDSKEIFASIHNRKGLFED